MVDEPAANPGGFFGRGGEPAQQAEDALRYVLGLSETPPASLGVDPLRAKKFVTAFLARNGLSVGRNQQKKEPAPMGKHAPACRKFEDPTEPEKQADGDPEIPSEKVTYDVICPECAHEFAFEPPPAEDAAEETTPPAEQQEGEEPEKKEMGRKFRRLSQDQALTLVRQRADVVAHFMRLGRESERKYRRDFDAIATASQFTPEQSKKFQTYYGRDLQTVREFALLMVGDRAKPISEGGVNLPASTTPGKTPAPVSVEEKQAAARERFKTDATVREMFGLRANVTAESPAWKEAEDKYARSVAGVK